MVLPGMLARGLVAGAVLVLVSCAQQPRTPAPEEPLFITHGVIVGDLNPHSAVLWARANREANLYLELSGEVSGEVDGGSPGSHHQSEDVLADADFTSSIELGDLLSGHAYHYRVWLESGATRSDVVEGTFATPPSGDVPTPVRFAFSGDLGGQNVCRDRERGYVILDVIAAEDYDFFIGLGDMIYADDICSDYGGFGNPQVPGYFGQSIDLEGFRAHWRYNWADDAFQRLVASTPYYALWDDHEVINDFGPRSDFGDRAPYRRELRLMPIGLQAFMEYNPIRRDVENPTRLYRRASWGQHLDLFFLDNRQYRDPNSAEDSSEQPKSMLGEAQKAWLKESLISSSATWKFIISSVPLSVPTGVAASADGWANFGGTTGFEIELREILEYLRDQEIDNVVFITTDIHYATGFEYQPFAETPEFKVREFIVGPMSASPTIRDTVDDTFNPDRLYLWGSNRDDIDGYEGFMKIMNYGEVEIDGGGAMRVRVVDGEGATIYQGEFQPQD
jgi:alkaline phosphatase D